MGGNRRTLSPIHLIVPTSPLASGLSKRPTSLTSPVFCPAARTDDPEYTCAFTIWALHIARPTSCVVSTGSPMRPADEVDGPDGWNRMRRDQVDMLRLE